MSRDELIRAVREHSLNRVMELIESGRVDVNAQDASGIPPLHYACHSGWVNGIDFLLGAGAEPEGLSHKTGYTALANAASRGHSRAVELLLAAGASVDATVQPVKKCSPEFLHPGMTPLMLAAMHGTGECVLLLLKAGADVNIPVPMYDATVLMSACFYNHTHVFDLLLRYAAPELLDWQDKQGLTVLMLASQKRRILFIERLLSSDGLIPDLDLQDKDGNTALMHACRADYRPSVEMLLNHGANVELVENDGFRAVDLAVDFGIVDLFAETATPVQQDFGCI